MPSRKKTPKKPSKSSKSSSKKSSSKSSALPIIKPFRGIRYNVKKIPDLAKVTAPPYDVISPAGQKALYDRHPNNIIRLILGYQNPQDTESDNRYTRAEKDFEVWEKEGVLKREIKSSFYLYEQEFEIPGKGRFKRRGFLATRLLEDFGKGGIRPHEKTLAGPKADRLLLTKACKANLSPIFGLYADPKKQLTPYLAKYFSTKPTSEFRDDEGIAHRLWVVQDEELFEKANKLIGSKPLFIADGHHRYETALNYRNEEIKQPYDKPDSLHRYVMMFFSDMSDPGLLILPTHRVLHHWKGFDFAKLKKALSASFDIASFAKKDEFLQALKKAGQKKLQAFGMLAASKVDPAFYVLTLTDKKRNAIPALKKVSPASRPVDTVVLHKGILEALLKMKEEEQIDPRYMEFVKDENDAIAARDREGTNVVFLLSAPRMDVLSGVVEAGEVLPPKTTYFYPKLASGLVINPLTNDAANELGDTPLLDMVVAEPHDVLTLYDPIWKRGWKAIVVFPEDNSVDPIVWKEMQQILKAKALPDGTPVTALSLIVPRREDAVILRAKALAEGFACVAYPQAHPVWGKNTFWEVHED